MNRHLYPQIRTIHVLSVIAVFAISAGILLAAQSGCIGATLAGTDGSYDTPDTGLSEHAPVQAVTAWEGMSNLIVACQIADTFADMLFTGMLDAAYAVHAVLSLTAVSNITDDSSLVLGRASDITTFVSGGHTYAAVAAYTDYGVQILDVTNPSNIIAAGNITDVGESTPDLELRGARGITTFESGGHTYAAVAAHLSDSVQILNVTDPSNITPAGHITDTPSLELEGASGITTFVSGSHTYAAVAASVDDGVQILNVTDPSNITPAGHITDTPSLELWDARGITIFELGVHTYAAVAAYEDDGVQILNVTDPTNITAAGSITDTPSLELEGASGITTFVSGGHTYAAVAAFEDDGVQILNVTDPLHITPAGSIDTNTLKLNGAQGITTFTSGDHTYVAVAANRDSGVQILDVTNPLRIVPAGNIADIGNNTDDLELYRAQGITTFTSDGHIYVAVAAYEDDGVQIIRIDIPPDTTLPADAFVTTWKTTSADQSITINFVGDDMNISWGDGTTETNLSGPQTHTYPKAGNYTVSVTGGLTGLTLDRPKDFLGFPGFVPELASIDQWGGISWTNMSNAFAGATNMVYNAGDAPDLSGVTDMSFMFGGATSFDGDLSSWDVSSVTNMNGMFNSASSFNQPLNSWNVSSVTDMTNMFIGASSFSQPLNSWDVSSVIYMSSMFFNAISFDGTLSDWNVSSVIYMSSMFFDAEAFNQPLNTWDVSSATSMEYMFKDATAFNQPLNTWDVSSVTNMEDMFEDATAFDQNLANWYVVQDLPPVLTANAMFSIRAQNSYLDGLVSTYSIDDTRFVMDGKTLSLNSINLPPAGIYPLDITAPAVLGEPNAEEEGHTRTLSVTVKGEHQPFITTWRTTTASQSITINFVGSGMDISWGDGMTETNLSGPQTHIYANVGDYRVSVTGGLTGLTLDRPPDLGLVPELASIDQWGGISWTNMSNAFAGASNMVYNATDTPNLSLVANMSNMFETATTFDGDLSSWDVSSVTDMSGIFSDASSFNQPLNTWDVSSVTDMVYMFSVATSFDQPLNTWDVSSVTNMFGMFSAATSFDQPLNTWDVSSVTDMSGMFSDASSFNRPLSAWDVSSVTDMFSMFTTATAFNQPLNAWDVSSVTNMNSMFGGATSFNQPLNNWDVSSVTRLLYMFNDATSFNQPLNAWDVSSVTEMDSMFNDATSFNQPLNNWDVSSVIYMEDMFKDAAAFNQDLSSWYITPDSAVLITDRSRTLTVMPLSPYIGEQSLGYTVSDTQFVMNGRMLSLNSANTPMVGSYDLAITAITVLDEPNAGTHTRTVTITVSDPPAMPFITTWRTDSADQTITVPVGGSTARYSIDWGDNSPVETDITGDSTHTYREADSYTVSISGGLERFHLDGQQPNAGRLISIDQWGNMYWTSMSGAFDGAYNMVYNATDTPDLGFVSDMSRMFAGAAAFDGEISEWDVSAVRDMSGMFAGAAAFDGEISEWDVSAVRDMSGMFDGATSFDQPLKDWDVLTVRDISGMFDGATSFDQLLNSWNVSSVRDMSDMFAGATSFDQLLNSWNVSSVRDMSGMFDGATSFDQLLNSWNVSSVRDMSDMFAGATSFNQPLNAWDVSAVRDMSSIFDGATLFDRPLDDWDVSSTTDMTRMFAGATSFNRPLDDWDISAATGMSGMFAGATAFDQNLSGWYVTLDGPAVIIPGNPRTPEVLPLSPYLDGHLHTYSVNNPQFVVAGRTLLLADPDSPPTAGNYQLAITTAAILGEPNTGSHTGTFEITVRDPVVRPFITTWMTDAANQTVTIPGTGQGHTCNIDWGDGTVHLDIFCRQTHTYAENGTHTVSISGGLERFHLDDQQPNAGRLASIDQWGDIRWTSMSGAFDGAYNMVYLATDAPDLSLVSDMSDMFAFAISFDGDLSSWDVSAVTDMSSMFNNAYDFNGDLSSWDVSAVTDMSSMFEAAIPFNGDLSSWDVSKVTDMSDMFSDAISFSGNLSGWNVSAVNNMRGMFWTAESFNQPLNSWNVSAVTNMNRMFASADSFNQTISSWDVSSVTDMHRMFYVASDFNQPLNAWNVSSVRDMSSMFFEATKFNQPLNAWNVSKVTSMASMFFYTPSFTQNLGNWYVTLDPDTIADTGIPGVVGTISAQNQPLKNHSPTYVIVDGLDKNHFEIVPGNQLNMISGVSGKAEYSVNVTASGSNVFEDGNNWRVLVVKVSGDNNADNADLGSLTISSGTLSPQFSSSVITYTASVDNSVTQVTVTPTASDSSAAITVNGNTVTSGTGHILTSLTAGEPTTVTVIVTAQDSTTKTYTITLTRAAPLSDNADLGGLTISSGTLSPQFSSSVITYTASVDNSVTQVTVTPTASDSSAAITVNGNTVTSDTGHILTSLTAGEPTTVTVIVTAQDSTTKTYTITLTRAAALSGNADLGGLTISSGTLSPQFSSSVITYTASVDNSVTQVTVTPTASDSSAAITVNGNTVTSDTGHILTSLTAGEPTTVTVIVTAQDSTTKTYTITLTRAAALSGNADLGSLTISSGTLSPQFSSSVITYTASVDNSVTQVTVTPTASDSSAAITVNGNTVTSGTGHILTSLTAGEPTTVTVIVTAQDSTTKTYTITLTRAAALSGNADLGSLTISSGTLSPQFSSSVITYTASVDNSVTQVTVTPTASDSSAAITVNGNTVTSGTGHILTGLTAGEPTTVTVIVTAQDSTTKTYTITLTRAAALSGNADLGSLTISSGTLSPQFSSSDITYTASVDNSVTQVTVTPTASDSSAAITVNGNTVTSGTGHILTGLTAGEPTTVTVIVTAQDSTTKTYTITLTRAAALSGNADLGGLTISSGTLSPQFSSSDITYTASVDNSVTQVTVTPTASDSSAAITVNGNTVTSDTGHILTGLTAGEPTTVTVIVTAQDSTTKTYTITLTRAAALSGNADLGSLTISSGTLSPQFSSSVITYTASVDNSVTQVTVTPTASDSSAAITVNGNTVTSDTGHILTSLTAGEPTTVTVIVTAQDSTTKTYTITLTRAAALSGNADLGSLTISSGTLSPQFSSSDITYTASVDNSVTQVTVTPTASDSSATITVNGNTVTSDTGHILTSLTAGEPTTVTVIVTAQDSTTKTYTITLTRAAALSGNADLGSLTISSGTLSPQFSSSDITYTASVDNSVTQVTVTPTASDSSATITVNGNTVTSGTGHILTSLTAGEPTTVTVIVTAQDSTTKTYTITLTRAAALSGNADLGGLTISSGTLSPQFSSSVITYTASVDNSVTQVTVTPTASDSSATITVNGNTVTSDNGYILTSLTVGTTTVTVIVTAQDSTTKTYIITVTVRDVPITVSSAAYNPGNGQLTITFNQDIATVDYSRLHVRSSANPDTGGITLSSVTGADYSGRTITATLDSEQQDQYDALQSPHLVVEDGAVTDTDGDRTTDVPPQPIRDASQKGSSSSPSSKAPIVHINALAQSRLVDIPPHITEQVESHDASDPLEPITPDDTFDLPLVINGYGYLLDAYENTLIPQTVTAGDNPVHITFTVYTEKEFAHFILYLNLQGRNTNYVDSDTYITYKDDGTTSVTDPHGYIGSATVTVTQEDDQIPEKRTVRITIEFGEEPMGPTNMVAYMWNPDREALFVKIIDALEVVAASPESAMQAADPEPLEPDSVLPADPEPVTPDFADDAADPEPVPYDILGPDDYDDTQILQIIRMWSGFESESITDAQLLELLGLDDHQGADIPDWMMTELGVLVAKGTVTVDEFMLALQYVLEHD